MVDDPGTTRRLGDLSERGYSLRAGDVVADWCVVRAIATGGFGSVYQATHRTSGVTGALKVLHPHLIGSAEIAARMIREAEIIAQLHHPNVVSLLDAGVIESGAPYLVMELLDGTDLDTVIADRGRFAPADAIAMLAPLCAAVHAAHARGVIHRDIKASNVLVCRDTDGDGERVVLVDFGIAKLLEGAGAELTASRQTLGTPASMAPEQIRGDAVDGRTDVYALGALAYHLLTGRMPFADASVTMSQYLHLHAARPHPSEIAPLSAALDEVVTRAMAIEAIRRPADPLALYAALRQAVASGGAAPELLAIDGAALLVRASHDAEEIDDALLDDLDAILPLIEPLLVAAGFPYMRDLGDAWLFVGEGHDATQLVAVGAAIRAALAARPSAHPRVVTSVRERRGAVVVSGSELRGGELADPSSW